MIRNSASQTIGAQLVSATDGSAFTGSVTCYVTGDGGTQAVGSVGSGACTHEGNGFHTYAPAQAETNYAHVAYTFVGTGAVPVTVQVYPSYPQTGDAFARIGANGASLSAIPWNASWDAEVQSEVTDALTDSTAGAVAWQGVVDQGTAQSATSTTLVLRSAAGFADDELIGATILITGGSAGVGQARLITDYVGSTDTATVEAWTTTPTGTITYKVYATAPGSGGSGLDAAGVRAAIGLASANLDTQLAALPTAAENAAAVWDEARSGHTTTGSFGQGVASVQGNVTGSVASVTGAVGSVTGNVGGNVVGSVASVTAGVTVTTNNDKTGYTVSTVSDKTGYSLSAAGVDAIWDEPQSGHVTADTFGAYLDSSISGVSTGGVSAADIADAVLDEALSGHATAGTLGAAVSDILTDTGTTIPAQVSGLNNLSSADAQSAAAAALTAYDPPTNAEMEARTLAAASYATATALQTVDDELAVVDTIADAIKAKTDQLTFTVTGQVDANAESMNATEILGTGTSADKWRGE